MIVFLVAPMVLERNRLPGIVGIILVGAAIGPNGLGLLERGETIQLLGEVGLIYLLFVAGLEINFAQFVARRDRSIVFGLLSFLVPQAVGTVVGIVVFDFSVAAASLFAAIFASHTLLAYPIVNRLGIVGEESMTATVGGTILTDTLALLVLAVVVASVDGELTTTFWAELAIGLTIFFAAVWFIVPRLGRWFFRIHDEERYYEFLFVMAILFASALLAELAGVEHIVGAFLAGLALNRLIPKTGTLMNRIEFVGNALFIPFFLLSVGMLVDVRVIADGVETLSLATALIAMVVATKYAAAWLTGRLYGYSPASVGAMFGLSVGQAAAALAIVQIGFDAGVPGFDRALINAVVLMILVVSVVSPAVVERAGSRIARSIERRAYDPTRMPQRILVPVSRESRYAANLLDLALSIRDERSGQPIHTVSVVRPDRTDRTLAEIASLEVEQSRLRSYAAGADVPVVGHRRLNHNVASGIVSAAIETRISTIVIGWDGARARTQRVFGHTIDQLLSRTTQLTVVGRIRDPLSTTERIVLVLPPDIEHNDGLDEVIHTITQLATAIGAAVDALAVEGDPAALERRAASVDPEASVRVSAVDDWAELESELGAKLDAGAMAICVSARRDDVGWHPELRTLPSRISTMTDGNFAVVYPATEERPDDRQFLQLP
nr:cation:proton antiporter [Halovivax gelatinilyticus]